MITTNSLGKRIAKTDAQIAAFWRWFGDSKVVDKRGRPLVVYHGLEESKADFNVFRPSKGGALGPGIYATSDVAVANDYTGAPWGRETQGQRIYPLYVRLLNPFIERPDKNMWDTFNPRHDAVDDIVVHQRMVAAGHDGIIGIGGTANVAARKGHIDVVAFKPEQVKSAISNRGTFTPEDPVLSNPPSQHWPVMSYAAAHRYEPLAKAKGVSAVARSGRGFMRAFEKAGSWAKLDQWWKDRRNNFVSRHMAQVRTRGEALWKNGRPSRRALALIMWAYMPPGKNPPLHGKGFRRHTGSFDKKQIRMGLKVEMEHTRRKDVALRIVKDHLSEDPRYYSKLKRAGLADELKKNPLYRTGRYLLKSKEVPEGRSNKVAYFLRGQQAPWQKGSTFGPDLEAVLRLSRRQARAIMAQRNPRTKVVHVKHKGRMLRVRLDR